MRSAHTVIRNIHNVKKNISDLEQRISACDPRDSTLGNMWNKLKEKREHLAAYEKELPLAIKNDEMERIAREKRYAPFMTILNTIETYLNKQNIPTKRLLSQKCLRVYRKFASTPQEALEVAVSSPNLYEVFILDVVITGGYFSSEPTLIEITLNRDRCYKKDKDTKYDCKDLGSIKRLKKRILKFVDKDYKGHVEINAREREGRLKSVRIAAVIKPEPDEKWRPDNLYVYGDTAIHHTTPSATIRVQDIYGEQSENTEIFSLDLTGNFTVKQLEELTSLLREFKKGVN